MTFFATMVLVQVVVLPINVWLLSRVKATNDINRAELAKWNEIAERGEEDVKAVEAYTQAFTDLLALQLAIRLQTPGAYWYN